MNTPSHDGPPRVADSVVQALASAGITRLFALSGNQIMPLFDACLDAGIEIIHARHEAACVYMAEAHAQLTGELGVALVTAGAGLGNAVGALLCAAESETPLLLLSGDSPCSQDGTGAFQEMPQVAMTAPLTRYSARPTTPEAVLDNLVTACASAVGHHPGPVHLALPADMLNAPAGTRATPVLAVRPQSTTVDPAITSAVQAAIDAAEQPLILLGPALNRTRQPALHPALAAATGAPVAVLESPRGLRDPACTNVSVPIAQADLIVLLGKRCDFTLGFGAPASADCRWIAVDTAGTRVEHATRNIAGNRLTTLSADPLSVALALAQSDSARPAGNWHTACANALAPPTLTAPAAGPSTLDPHTLCTAVQAAIANAHDPILVCDGGEFGQWAQAICHAPRRVLNAVAGSIGGGIPQAIAASLAYPAADVFVLMGDGSAGFHIAEFDTAVRHGARFTAVIGNDRRWNAEHQIQLREFGAHRTHGCALGEADYAAFAEACDARGNRATTLTDVLSLLQARHESVACIDVAMTGAAAPSPTQSST